MPCEQRKESEKNGDSQGKDDRSVNFTRDRLRQQEAQKAATDNDGYSSQVFGLHHLQDMKGESAEIIGAYDHQQERWISKESGSVSEYTVTSTHQPTSHLVHTGRRYNKDDYYRSDMDIDSSSDWTS